MTLTQRLTSFTEYNVLHTEFLIRYGEVTSGQQEVAEHNVHESKV